VFSYFFPFSPRYAQPQENFLILSARRDGLAVVAAISASDSYPRCGASKLVFEGENVVGSSVRLALISTPRCFCSQAWAGMRGKPLETTAALRGCVHHGRTPGGDFSFSRFFVLVGHDTAARGARGDRHGRLFGAALSYPTIYGATNSVALTLLSFPSTVGPWKTCRGRGVCVAGGSRAPAACIDYAMLPHLGIVAFYRCFGLAAPR